MGASATVVIMPTFELSFGSWAATTGAAQTSIAASQVTIAAAQTTLAASETAGNVFQGVQLALAVAQLAIYYNKAEDAIDARDAKIDKQMIFMQDLQNMKVNTDLPMLNDKKDVLTDFIIPTIEFCQLDFGLYLNSKNDSDAFMEKSEHLADQSRGIPNGWMLHEPQIKAMKIASYNQGIELAANKRRYETLRKNKTRLVTRAQSSLKSAFNAGDTMSKYSQAGTIYDGLAQGYVQGFNSAGASLGTILGRMSNGD